MLDTIAGDIVRMMGDIFFTGDWISLAIAVVVVLGAAFTINKLGQAPEVTLGALIVYGFANFLKTALLGPNHQTGGIAAQAESSWNGLMAMSAGNLVMYFITFLVAIMISFSVISLMRHR